jgi:hypothetical protein
MPDTGRPVGPGGRHCLALLSVAAIERWKPAGQLPRYVE